MKRNDYDFDLIISSEDLKKNREKYLNSNKKNIKKKTNQIKKFSVGLLIAIIIFISLIIVINNDMENHIENVSNECAMHGYGITAKYTKEGEKYYVCKK